MRVIRGRQEAPGGRGRDGLARPRPVGRRRRRGDRATVDVPAALLGRRRAGGSGTRIRRRRRHRGRGTRAGIELDRLLGHRPRAVTHRDEVLPAAELERRLTLLRATWAYFDDVVGAVSGELLPSGRTYGRTAEQIARQVYISEPEQMSRKVEVRTDRDAVMTPDGLAAPGRHLWTRSARTTRRPASPDVADPVPDPPDGPARDGSRMGARGPGTRCGARAVVGRQPGLRSRSSISQAWSSMCHAQRRMRNCSAHVRAISPRALWSRIAPTNAAR